ncbi:alpha/beta hydrolase fold domain-containing protein [Haloferula sp.]|uniref:alpha/beta hydrolase fold domain-containing protein n=1 Tax=Haloferula sp. TaxID=2497595 RepID=UPI00329B0BD4
MKPTLSLIAAVLAGVLPSAAAEYDGSVPKPTHAAVSYGPHKRNVLDFWKAETEKPAPVAFVVHGGGWGGNSKEAIHKFVDTSALLEAGVSVVAINYRYLKQAGDLQPPVKAPMNDSARALQFVRSKAKEWNIDKERIGGVGGSAGACTSLWLAYHDDLADPSSKDPVTRESTRLFCVAAIRAQTTLDPKQMKEWIPNSKYGNRAFAKKDFAEFLADRDEILPWIEQYSPYALLTADDAPTYLYYITPPNPGAAEKDPTHSANFGVGLQERCKQLDVACELVHPKSRNPAHPTATDYLIKTLNASP